MTRCRWCGSEPDYVAYHDDEWGRPVEDDRRVGNLALRTFLRNGMALTSSGFQIVDVRDLAALHAALLQPGAQAGRYIAAGHFFSWRALADLLDALTGGRVRRVRVPGALLRGLGRLGDAAQHVRPFDLPLSAEAMDYATRWPGSERSPEVEALGVGFRDARETLADALRWLCRAGYLEPRRAGRLAGD